MASFGIKIGSVTTGTAMLRPVALWDVPGNAWGDAFTKVECRIVRHVDKQQAVVACVVGPV